MSDDKRLELVQDEAWSATKWQRHLMRSGFGATLRARELTVIGVLLSYANHQGEAWPSLATIGRDAGLCRRSVQYALDALVERGLVQCLDAGGGRRSTTYAFQWTGWKQAAEPAAKGVRGARPCTPEVHVDAPQGCMQMHPRGARGCTPEVHVDAPQGCMQMHPKIRIEGNHGRNDDDEGTREPAAAPPDPRAGPDLFGQDVVVVLLRDLSNLPAGIDGWAGNEAQRDARTLIERFGPGLVRQALEHNLARVKRGRFNAARHSFRGAVVRYCEAAQRGTPWVDDRMAAKAAEARRRAQAEGEARRQAAAAARAADAEALAERNDELLWSQLSQVQREELHRAVVARYPFLASRPADGPMVRGAMLAECKRQTAAG
jgi:hypothetical protein